MTTTKRSRRAQRALDALKALPNDDPSREKPGGNGKSAWSFAYDYLTSEKATALDSWSVLPPNALKDSPLARLLLAENE